MQYHIFQEEADSYKAALLIKRTAFTKTELEANYVDPLVSRGVSSKDVIAWTLAYNNNKASVKFIKEYLDKLLKALNQLQVKYLYVADTAYFKVLAGKPKAEPHLGYALPCKIKNYEHMTVVLGVNHQQLIYNPDVQDKLDLSLNTLASVMNGTYQELGTGIIKSASYPKEPQEIQEALKQLHQYPRLACDIEAFSLRFDKAGIGTITFAWDQHHGIAFACDYQESEDGQGGSFVVNPTVRKLLKEFFENYQGELIFHKASYDTKAIIYALWMDNPFDTKGLLTGLDILTQRMHDTMIISYLATNTTAGNHLSLKTLAHEFAGNWAVEVKDISTVPLDQLLEYNLIDGLSTNYVYDKYSPIMEADNQGDLYRGLFLDSLKLIIQLELTGMPMSRSRIQEVKSQLQTIQQSNLNVINSSPEIQQLNKVIQHNAMVAANAKLKVKQHPLSKFSNVIFNPNSGTQLRILFYDQMGLPVIDTTDGGLPATGAETIEKLINHTTSDNQKKLLEGIVGYTKATKLLSTFIPAFERATVRDNSDIVWLHGNLNIGGAVSGRLSSSDPNLQNIPSGSTYGDLTKSCFQAPVGWLFGGADSQSLEDYISALTTKDPNKLRVYEKGFDGHCFRAAYYFRDQLSHIDLDDPDSVNTIKTDYPELRQASKAPTFALTYQGTYRTLINNLGWPEDKAKKVEENYHSMYRVSDQYVDDKLKQASKDGYVTVAFGLRIRTPLLSQIVYGSGKTPYEAEKEGRTAGNALGQSYGLLNNRAAVAFFKKVWASPYRYDVLPVGLIHDAIYILIRDDIEVVTWVNEHLIKEMQWQELPEIQHPTVKLGAELDIFWPSWANKITLPNGADPETIIQLCHQARDKHK